MDGYNSNYTQTKEKKSFFRSNPVMNRLNKVEERSVDGKAASYGRITAKTIYFLIVTVAGMMLYLVLKNTIFAGQPQTMEFTYENFRVSTSPIELGFFAGAAILAIVTQILAAFIRGTIPVTGTLYSLCQGFAISFIVFTIIKGYEYLGLLALLITVTIVLVMSILYSTGAIRVTKKFKMIMLTLFATVIGISIISFIGYLIPLTRPFVAAVMNNLWISIGLTLLSIIIASLFLISDFATIDYVVENRLSSKYEWSAAFGLAFTVLWIYIKVLDLLIQIIGNSKRD